MILCFLMAKPKRPRYTSIQIPEFASKSRIKLFLFESGFKNKNQGFDNLNQSIYQEHAFTSQGEGALKNTICTYRVQVFFPKIYTKRIHEFDTIITSQGEGALKYTICTHARPDFSPNIH